MTIILTFCSQTILQKSAMVLRNGPWVQMKSLSELPPCTQFNQSINQSMYCLKCSLTIEMVSEHFWEKTSIH